MTAERINNLLVWPDSPGRWRYLPLVPTPQRNEAGRPMVTVMEAGGMVMLTIGARLQADEAELATVRKQIAVRTGLPETAVDLRPGEAQVLGASLRLVAPDRTETELAAARPSNLPPYSAAFSAMLQGDRATEARTALPEGRIIVRYEIGLPTRRNATAELSGPWNGLGPVAAALDRGDLRLRTTADEGASPALVKRAVDRVMAEATAMPNSPASADAQCTGGVERTGTFVEVTETETGEDRLKLEAGVAEWMK